MLTDFLGEEEFLGAGGFLGSPEGFFWVVEKIFDVLLDFWVELEDSSGVLKDFL